MPPNLQTFNSLFKIVGSMKESGELQMQFIEVTKLDSKQLNIQCPLSTDFQGNFDEYDSPWSQTNCRNIKCHFVNYISDANLPDGTRKSVASHRRFQNHRSHALVGFLLLSSQGIL